MGLTTKEIGKRVCDTKENLKSVRYKRKFKRVCDTKEILNEWQQKKKKEKKIFFNVF